MRGMLIDNEFELGQIVYLITDEDNLRRVVTRISVVPGGAVCYELSCAGATSGHYGCEIALVPNLAIAN